MESRTLLNIVNDCLDSLDYEVVSDIDESIESQKVHRIIRGQYYLLASMENWDSVTTVTQLTGLGDTTQPTVMKIPDTVATVQSIRYDNTETGDTNKTITDIVWYENPEDFLNLIYSRNTGDSNVEVKTCPTGQPIWVLNDTGPTCATIFDGKYVVFDAYNSAEENTLVAAKSVVVGIAADAWTASNSFEPPLPPLLVPAFIAKCKVVCNEYLRQVTLREDSIDSRSMINRQKRKKRVKEVKTKPNYGRSNYQ